MKNILRKFLIVTVIHLSLQAIASEEKPNISTIGRTSLKVPGSKYQISIVHFDEYIEDGHRFWKSKLVIKEDGKVLIQKYPILKEINENQFHYFVPIKKKQYLMDLDYNADYEFAVVVDHGGNAVSTRVIVFSLKGSKLDIYKEAWYLMEGGEEVIWDKDMLPVRDDFTETALLVI